MNNFFLIILLTTFLLVTGTYAQSKGGFWHFDNDGIDAADWDQSADNGLLYNSAHFSDVDPVPGCNSYLDLDSLNNHDFFQVADSPDLDFDNENMGISMWIRPVQLSNVHFLINKGVQDAVPKTTNYALRISKSKTLEFLIRDANNQAQVASSQLIIPVGEWTFVAAYYDFSAKTVQFWNKPEAEPAETVNFDFDFFPNDDPLTIGAWAVNDTVQKSNSDFEGNMDEVRISGRLQDIIPFVSAIRPQTESSRTKRNSLNVYPNPVSVAGGAGHIQFDLYTPSTHPITYTIYNILGQKIFRGELTAAGKGSLQYRWNLRDSFNHLVNPGIYFIEFTGLSKSVRRKLFVIK